MNITRSDADPSAAEISIKTILENPLFNRLQVFSNQCIRVVDNASLKYLHISESIYEMTGYTRAEVEKGGLWFTYKHIHPIDLLKLGRVLLKVRKALNSLTPDERLASRLTFDIRFKCKDSKYKWILQNVHTLSLSPSGKPHILLFTSSDITPYKRGEAMNYSLHTHREGKGFITIIEGSLQNDSLPLSVREVEILKLTSEGHSEKEISDILFLSKETVKTHRRNMLQKTEAKNSVDMVRMGIANGWI